MCQAIENRRFGRLAQLGEHLPYKQGVTGSSPVVPTKKITDTFLVSVIFYKQGDEPLDFSLTKLLICDIISVSAVTDKK